MCDETFWNVRWRYTQERSPLPVGCDVQRDILKHHDKIHKGEKPFAWRMCQGTFCKCYEKNTHRRKTFCLWDVWRDLFQSDRPEMSCEDTHRIKALCLQDVWQDILKHHEKIHTREKPFACRMCDETFWKVTRRCKQDKSPLPAGFATRHFEMSREDTHKRKACWIYDETFVNRTDQKCHEKIPTGEKPFACMMCDEAFWNVTINHQMKYLSTTLTETLDLALRFKEPSFII